MSGAENWPPFNPFPFRATSTAPDNAVDLADPPSGGVTILFPHVTRAGDLVRDYLRDYAVTQSGRVAMLNGEHGSGKSHTIRHLIERIANGSWQDSDLPPAVKLVVKIVSADFMSVYQTLMSQIDQQLLASVAYESFNTLAGEQWVHGASGEVTKDLIKERLQSDKGAAMQAFSEYLVDRDAVEARQARDLVRVGIGYGDFQRAVPFILSEDKDLARVAHAWITNKPLSDAELRKLGVKSAISSIDVCLSALQLITSLFKRARRPLLVFLDQCEKLTKKDEATPGQIADNLAALRQLVDMFPDNGAFLLAAGTDEAWGMFSEDLQARFRPGLITVPRVDQKEATEVITAYIDAARPAGSASSIFPFTDDGLASLYRFSRGTLRALLQSAWALYNEAAKSPRSVIDAGAVDRALANGWITPPATVDEVKDAVLKQLQSSGLTWRKDFPITDNFKAQYAVVDSSESATLVVHVTGASFHDEEVLNAQRVLSAIRHWQRTLGERPRLGMVVTGYVSDRVLDLLGSRTLENVVRVIVYDPATFEREFSALLAGARKAPRPAASGEDEAKLRDELDRVRNELQTVRQQSEGNVDRLEKRLQEVLSGAGRPATAEPAAVIHDRWREERRGIEREIEAKRAERAKNEFDQLRRGARRAEQLRTRRLMIPMASAALLGVLIMLYPRVRFLGLEKLYEEQRAFQTQWTIVGGVIAVLAVIVFLVIYFRVLSSTTLQAAAGNVESLEELEQFRLPRPKQFLQDHNPQIRYVAWNSADLTHTVLDSYLRGLFASERLSLIRRAAANAFVQAQMPTPDYLTGFFDIAEFAYVIDRRNVDLSNAPRQMQLLARISDAHTGGDFVKVFEILAGSSGRPGFVNDAFVNGRVVGADVIGRPACRAALSLLSPFDEGLGTLDHLKCIDTVDELFLFFKREMFFAERGVSDATVVSPAPPSP